VDEKEINYGEDDGKGAVPSYTLLTASETKHSIIIFWL